jgi:hypothetical protein
MGYDVSRDPSAGALHVRDGDSVADELQGNDVAVAALPWEGVHSSDGLRFALEKALPLAPSPALRRSQFPAHPTPHDQVLDLTNLVHSLRDLVAVLDTLRLQDPFAVRALSLKGCRCLKLASGEELEAAAQALADFVSEPRGTVLESGSQWSSAGTKKQPSAQGSSCVEVLYLGVDAGGALPPKLLKLIFDAWKKSGHLHEPAAWDEVPEPGSGLPVTLKRKPCTYAPAAAARLALMPGWAAEGAAVKPKKDKGAAKGKKKK